MAQSGRKAAFGNVQRIFLGAILNRWSLFRVWCSHLANHVDMRIQPIVVERQTCNEFSKVGNANCQFNHLWNRRTSVDLSTRDSSIEYRLNVQASVCYPIAQQVASLIFCRGGGNDLWRDFPPRCVVQSGHQVPQYPRQIRPERTICPRLAVRPRRRTRDCRVSQICEFGPMPIKRATRNSCCTADGTMGHRARALALKQFQCSLQSMCLRGFQPGVG